MTMLEDKWFFRLVKTSNHMTNLNLQGKVEDYDEDSELFLCSTYSFLDGEFLCELLLPMHELKNCVFFPDEESRDWWYEKQMNKIKCKKEER